ncbi:Carboxy-S-adenosyl-L-methionine synthase [Diplonema papillatum]|nr:Carboxy-S-adenosyl-L-methionine synthase [Diplonema papillatum]
MSCFSDAEAVARYAEGPVKLVPGFRDLQRMTLLLLAERVPKAGSVLVLGAGGGLELKVFADAQPEWRFAGVDPSREMLDLAAKTVGPAAAGRVQLVEGYVGSAPDEPFDGATCLLTMHFMPVAERKAALLELRRRLKPGAPLVVAHHSFPREPAAEKVWLDRYAAFAFASGVPEGNARNASAAISKKLPAVSPEEDEALLREAGFAGVKLFYAGFTFRGWIAYAPEDPSDRA